jgi:PEP-CTERM motif
MSVVFSIRAAGLAASLVAGAAMAQTVVAPGGSVSVPGYVVGSLPQPPTTTLLAATCGYFFGGACSTAPNPGALESTGESILASGNGGFLEAAGTTNLNPYGASDVAIGFIIGGGGSTVILSATVSALAGYNTQVQACGPIFGSEFEGCTGVNPGNATRSGGAGDSISFTSALGPMAFLPTQSILGEPATEAYVIYTNAPVTALVDPNNFSVSYDGEALSFAGLGLTPPSVTPPPKVPEPATLGLLALGLAGIGLRRRKR